MRLPKFLGAVTALALLALTSARVGTDSGVREQDVSAYGAERLVNLKHSTHASQRRGMVGPRAALQSITDEKYQYLQCEGGKLLSLMTKSKKDAENQDPRAFVTPWDNYNALEQWGWSKEGLDDYYWNIIKYRPTELDDPLRHYQLSHIKDDNHKQYAWNHVKETEHDNTKYPATQALYKNSINIHDGLIIRQENRGPKAVSPSKTHPKLSRMSDILYLSWKKELADQRQNSAKLRYIIAYKVTNQITLGALVRGAKASGREVKNDSLDDRSREDFDWEHRMGWKAEEEMGQVLIASPNGLAQSYLLVQHKDAFGERARISYVEFYCTGTATFDFSVHMIYHVSSD